MNESSREPTPSSTKNEATVAAQAVLARRSNERIPLSLGKASLRIRLEAYYSLISPETLSNRTEWLRKYDQIYEKYGGTFQGERKLATKLAKKYGTAVRLLLVPKETARKTEQSTTRVESWYQLRSQETGSGVVNFLSSDFDPIAALTRASKEEVCRVNPWMEGSSILDNLSKCASLLPDDDPLHRDEHHQIQLRKTTGQSAMSTKESLSTNSSKDIESRKRPRNNAHPFDTIASYLESGPHSFLFRMKEERKRVIIVVRYVNMIRGTLCGTLIAFDKHMNMILKDVEEVYSPRIVNEEHDKSNLELELERLRRVRSQNQGRESGDESSSLFEPGGEHLAQQPGTWNVKKRQMKQLMVRGDMVVSIYEAAQENRSITKSRYSKHRGTIATEDPINDSSVAVKRQKVNLHSHIPSG